MDTVRTRTLRAVGWTAGSRVVIQVVQFAVTAVLARLLTPEDFGLMAIATVFTGFAWVIADLGVGQAVIWVPEATERLKATAFWVNAVAGVVLTAALAAAAPWIADAFGNTRLQPIVIVVALSFTVSLYVVHAAILQRTLQFARIVLVEVVAVVGYSAVGISLAAAGFGPMSLAYASLSQSVLTTVAYWVAVRWRPHHGPDRASFTIIRRYSAGLFGSGVLGYWTRNVDNLLVGRFTSIATLGVYNRAYNLMQLPITQVTSAVGRVLFPAFTQVRDDVTRLRSAYLRVVTMVSAFVIPMAVGLAACAPAFVATVYGPRWSAVAPLLTILALSAPGQILGTLNGPVYQALGRTGSQFRRSIVGFLGTLVAVAVGLHWGAMGVCVGLLLRYYLLIPNNVSGIWPALHMRIALLFDRLRGVVAAGALSGAAMFAVRLAGPPWPAPIVLLAQASVGVAVYVTALRLLDPRAFHLVRRFGREHPRAREVPTPPEQLTHP